MPSDLRVCNLVETPGRSGWLHFCPRHCEPLPASSILLTTSIPRDMFRLATRHTFHHGPGVGGGCIGSIQPRFRRPQSQSASDKDDRLHPIFSTTKAAPLPSFKTDPYPIPLQNPNHPTTGNSTKNHTVDQEIYHQIDQLKQIEHQHQESYNDNHSPAIDKLCSRLVYQSRKRGIVEIELLLSTFVESQRWLQDWDLSRLNQYSRLLMLPDWDLYYYLVKKLDPPENSEFFNSELLNQLRVHTSNSNKTVRIMPSLQA